MFYIIGKLYDVAKIQCFKVFMLLLSQAIDEKMRLNLSKTINDKV